MAAPEQLRAAALLPDFVIIGAMKCATSTLAAQLAAQPGIFLTTPKEPNFFSDDAVHAQGPDWYRGLFADAAPGDLKGEASTHYTKLPTYPQSLARMQALLPAPRLVYLIRNPLDRVVSHYIHEWTMGVMGGDLEEALNRHPELVSYGCYGQQVAPYLEAYGPGSVLLTSLEEMTRAPQAVLERVCAHLGYKGTPHWQEALARENVSAERIRRLPLHDLLVEHPLAAALRRALVPRALRERIRRSRQIQARPQMSAATRQRLEAVFAEDFELLCRLFPGHDHLAASYPFLDMQETRP